MAKIICSHCFLEFPDKLAFAHHNIDVAYRKAKRKAAYQAKKIANQTNLEGND